MSNTNQQPKLSTTLRQQLKADTTAYLDRIAPNVLTPDQIDAIIDSALADFARDLNEALANGRVNADPRLVPRDKRDAFTEDDRQRGPL